MSNDKGDNRVFSQYAVQQQTPFDANKLANPHRHQDRGWSIPEAYIGLMVAAAKADGRVDVEEEKEIAAVARRSRALRALSPEQLADAQAKASARLRENAENAIEDACKTLPAELCLPAFTHCVDIVLADGELLESEARWLEGVMPKLDIDADHGRRILEVLLLKANY
jgi:uncharacterized tellurite resistance protein B-like protein